MHKSTNNMIYFIVNIHLINNVRVISRKCLEMLNVNEWADEYNHPIRQEEVLLDNFLCYSYKL